MQTNPQPQPKATTPLHVAIIMDGNGRWAEQRGLPRTAGHEAGAAAVRHVVLSALEHGVDTLTLYAFSTYNWSRPEAEVAGLMALLRRFLLVEARALREHGIAIRFLGRRDRLPVGLAKAMAASERSTSAGNRMQLCIAIDYSAREAILHAAHTGLAPGAIAANLGTPDVDLLIRTGGDRRLSDFLLWECAHAELLFTPVKWPDFGPAQLEEALTDFHTRTRSYGNVVAPV